jgi:hypothetical protein
LWPFLGFVGFKQKQYCGALDWGCRDANKIDFLIVPVSQTGFCLKGKSGAEAFHRSKPEWPANFYVLMNFALL